MAYVIGVDVGGTFTDAVLDDDAGTVLAAKSPSTPPDYSRGVIDVLELLAEQLGVGLPDMLAGTHHIAHGTTSSLNALVMGNVPPVGFLTTKGHRDSIFIMNVEGRYLGRSPHELQNVLGQAKDHALLPNRHALEVTERVDRDGTVIVALDEDQARAAIRSLLDDGIRAIAVSLLWSFRNPVHERRLRELIAEQDPAVFVALSSEISPRIREFARNATTIMSTQIGPGGGVMLALLPILASDIPWSAGGLMRCFDLVAEEGTLNNATFPAAVSRGPIGPAWLTGSLVAECLSGMLDRSLELGKNVQATCCGTWDTAVIAGLDERGEQPAPFLNIIMEPMAGGYGARPHADGMDTGGLFCIPMGRIPDVEMTEFLYPVLTLWRREVPDSGGPGRHRGGVAASVAITPHGTSVPMGLILASAGKAVAQNAGLCGGHPGNTGLDVIARNSRISELLAAGQLPSTLPEISDTLEAGQNYATSYLAPGEVFTMTWQGGGGYGDPLTRDPDAVARDVRENKVTVQAARTVYGVIVADGVADPVATTAERDRHRARRRERSQVPGGSRGKASLAAARRLDDNLVQAPAPGGRGTIVACQHCAEILGSSEPDGTLALARYEGPSAEAGPQIIADPADYVDEPVVFRQYCCPSCWTALHSAVVPAGHPGMVTALGWLTATAPAR